MTTNATVDDRHTEQAFRIYANQSAIAQNLANLEAARAENADLTNRLAEIWQFARDAGLDLSNLASGHTPSPCPSCAAKDEAMAERAREVSEACSVVIKNFEHYSAGAGNTVGSILSRFIIPPADPVAEALKAAWTKLWPEDTGIPTACQALRDELAKHGLELSRLGGAK